MNKLFYLVFSLLILLFVGCKEEEIAVNIEELTDDKQGFLLGDSVLLKGKNLHKVNRVYLAFSGNKIDASHRNMEVDFKNIGNSKEDELLLHIPMNPELLGEEAEVILRISYTNSDGTQDKEEESGKFLKILEPSIKSISRRDFNDQDPAYIILENFKKDYGSLISYIQFYKQEYNGDPDHISYSSASAEILSDDSISIYSVRREAPIFIYFNWKLHDNDRVIDDPRDAGADFTLETDSLKMYYSYDLPTDQVYAPGSFMLITGDHTDILKVFDEAVVGGYPAKYGYYWPGEIGMVMPTTIPFSEGDKFEMVLPKEEGYLNFDNSHNEIELVDGKYRVVDEDESDIFFETNVYYRGQFISYAIVSPESDTVWYDYRETNEYETSSGVNYGYKIQKNRMPQGDHQLLIYSDDRKYQLKPAGNINFSVE
jgi:hypothetical protein